MDFDPGTKVNVPGVYCGNNFLWVAENTVTMMNMYLQGHKNKKESCPYPFALREEGKQYAPIPIIMKGIAAQGKPLVIVSESKADRKAELVQVRHLEHLAQVNMGQKLHDDGTEQDQEMET